MSRPAIHCWYDFFTLVFGPPTSYLNPNRMKETSFKNLSLSQQESLVKEKGQLLEAEDFYSFFMVSYLVNQDPVRLYYDYSGKLVEVEAGEKIEISLQSTTT